MGRGTWQYSLGVSSIIDAFVRVDGRSHLLSGAIDGSEANRIISDFKVRVGSNGNLLWEASALLGRKKGGVRVARKDDHEVTEGREDVREVFQQCGSEAKRKLSRCRRNQMGFGSMLGKREKVIACTSRQLKVLKKDCLTNVVDVAWLGPTSVKRDREWFILVRQGLDLYLRDVRTLAIEEVYTIKYSIHPRADTMLCGFRLTNRWLSMKKDIASCGSKYLAYLEVEVEYQGSSGLLLQPELTE
ncbi:hypothetical protein Tco_0439530 [Tanacetum coccineum]